MILVVNLHIVLVHCCTMRGTGTGVLNSKASPYQHQTSTFNTCFLKSAMKTEDQAKCKNEGFPKTPPRAPPKIPPKTSPKTL